MKNTVLWTLAGLNVLLGAGICFKYMPANVAHAQVRRPGEYITVPGTLPGQPAGVVYLLDSAAGELVAISYDENNNRVSVMPKIDLKSVFNQTVPGRK